MINHAIILAAGRGIRMMPKTRKIGTDVGSGVYLTILASIVMLLATFGVVKRRKDSNTKLNNELDDN